MPKGPIGPGLSKKRVLSMVKELFYSKTETDTKLSAKADASAVTEALNTKANTSDVNTALGKKANTSDVNSALAGKANANAVMPISGGTFTGTAYAKSANISNTALRNGQVQSSSGGAVSSNYIIYRRK